MDDVFTSLKFRRPGRIFQQGCFRPNLFYDVIFSDLLNDPYEDLKKFAKKALGPVCVPGLK